MNNCIDHWHCDPREASHACDRSDRMAPCPTCKEDPPIILTDNDLRNIDRLTLDPHTLTALAKLVSIHLEIENRERGNCYATPKGHEMFEGSFMEVSAFVRGYVIAHMDTAFAKKGAH